MDKSKQDLILETKKSINNFLCAKCKGVVVRSFALSMLACQHGKRCSCKK